METNLGEEQTNYKVVALQQLQVHTFLAVVLIVIDFKTPLKEKLTNLNNIKGVDR